jgi:hypothetical protein
LTDCTYRQLLLRSADPWGTQLMKWGETKTVGRYTDWYIISGLTEHMLGFGV